MFPPLQLIDNTLDIYYDPMEIKWKVSLSPSKISNTYKGQYANTKRIPEQLHLLPILLQFFRCGEGCKSDQTLCFVFLTYKQNYIVIYCSKW